MTTYWDDKAIDPPRKPETPISSEVLKISYTSSLQTDPPEVLQVCAECVQGIPPANEYIDIGIVICLSCATVILANHFEKSNA